MNFSDTSTHNRDNRFQALLDECRDMALVYLSAQLNDLFASTDEALLEFAEHAESNAMQSRFFEAMGAVRKNRSEIEHIFREEIHDGFDRFLQSPVPSGDQELPLEELKLINPEDMDESVATENLIIQCRSIYFGQLYALGQRLAVLNHGRKFPEKDIPAGPTHLVDSFRVSIDMLSIDSKAKIVLYALFEKFIVRHLQGMYDEFNGNLKNAGILPNLKATFARSESDASHGALKEEQNQDAQSAIEGDENGMGQESGADLGTGAGAGASAGVQTSLGEELFSSILQLLAARHHPVAPGHSRAGTAGGGVGAYAVGSPGGNAGGPSGAGVVAPREQLMSTIDNMRPSGVGQGRGVLSDLEALPRVAVDPNFLNNLKGVIASEREEIFSEIPPEQMPGIDADTIDLIGMLFEYMLDDPLLPNLAKALLSHLHTPYLKMSLTDSNLLVDSEHPARLLLDMLVEAGGQWVYENDINRGIFPQMQIVVDRVLRELNDNAELLTELLEYFKAVTDEYRRKTEAIELRAQESVKGREKLKIAKQRAAGEIRARTERVRLPRSAEQFLTQTWTDRLVFILLRREDSEISEEWNRTLQTADELIWLFGPEGASADEMEIRQAGAAIGEEIEQALDALGGFHARYLNQLLAFLSSPAAILRWHQKHAETPYSEPLVPDSDARLSDGGNKDLGTSPVDLSRQPRQPGEDGAKREGSLSKPEQAMVEKLLQLQLDTWFEFTGKGDETRHLKLSWLSPLTATCMFVDKNGTQAQINTLADTARMMVSGEAKIILKPKKPFVERALLAIKNALKGSSVHATD